MLQFKVTLLIICLSLGRPSLSTNEDLKQSDDKAARIRREDDGQYHPDNEGQYVPSENEGRYIHDNSGQYVHQEVKYVHQQVDPVKYIHEQHEPIKYVHKEDKYIDKDSGSSHVNKDEQYIHDDSGKYVHQDVQYVHQQTDPVQYVHEQQEPIKYIHEEQKLVDTNIGYNGVGKDGQYVRDGSEKYAYVENKATNSHIGDSKHSQTDNQAHATKLYKFTEGGVNSGSYGQANFGRYATAIAEGNSDSSGVGVGFDKLNVQTTDKIFGQNGNDGKYVHDDSGRYVHMDSKYVHNEGSQGAYSFKADGIYAPPYSNSLDGSTRNHNSKDGSVSDFGQKYSSGAKDLQTGIGFGTKYYGNVVSGSEEDTKQSTTNSKNCVNNESDNQKFAHVGQKSVEGEISGINSQFNSGITSYDNTAALFGAPLASSSIENKSQINTNTVVIPYRVIPVTKDGQLITVAPTLSSIGADGISGKNKLEQEKYLQSNYAAYASQNDGKYVHDDSGNYVHIDQKYHPARTGAVGELTVNEGIKNYEFNKIQDSTNIQEASYPYKPISTVHQAGADFGSTIPSFLQFNSGSVVKNVDNVGTSSIQLSKGLAVDTVPGKAVSNSQTFGSGKLSIHNEGKYIHDDSGRYVHIDQTYHPAGTGAVGELTVNEGTKNYEFNKIQDNTNIQGASYPSKPISTVHQTGADFGSTIPSFLQVNSGSTTKNFDNVGISSIQFPKVPTVEPVVGKSVSNSQTLGGEKLSIHNEGKYIYDDTGKYVHVVSNAEDARTSDGRYSKFSYTASTKNEKAAVGESPLIKTDNSKTQGFSQTGIVSTDKLFYQNAAVASPISKIKANIPEVGSSQVTQPGIFSFDTKLNSQNGDHYSGSGTSSSHKTSERFVPDGIPTIAPFYVNIGGQNTKTGYQTFTDSKSSVTSGAKKVETGAVVIGGSTFAETENSKIPGAFAADKFFYQNAALAPTVIYSISEKLPGLATQSGSISFGATQANGQTGEQYTNTGVFSGTHGTSGGYVLNGYSAIAPFGVNTGAQNAQTTYQAKYGEINSVDRGYAPSGIPSTITPFGINVGNQNGRVHYQTGSKSVNAFGGGFLHYNTLPIPSFPDQPSIPNYHSEIRGVSAVIGDVSAESGKNTDFTNLAIQTETSKNSGHSIGTNIDLHGIQLQNDKLSTGFSFGESVKVGQSQNNRFESATSINNANTSLTDSITKIDQGPLDQDICDNAQWINHRHLCLKLKAVCLENTVMEKCAIKSDQNAFCNQLIYSIMSKLYELSALK